MMFSGQNTTSQYTGRMKNKLLEKITTVVALTFILVVYPVAATLQLCFYNNHTMYVATDSKLSYLNSVSKTNETVEKVFAISDTCLVAHCNFAGYPDFNSNNVHVKLSITDNIQRESANLLNSNIPIASKMAILVDSCNSVLSNNLTALKQYPNMKLSDFTATLAFFAYDKTEGRYTYTNIVLTNDSPPLVSWLVKPIGDGPDDLHGKLIAIGNNRYLVAVFKQQTNVYDKLPQSFKQDIQDLKANIPFSEKHMIDFILMCYQLDASNTINLSRTNMVGPPYMIYKINEAGYKRIN